MSAETHRSAIPPDEQEDADDLGDVDQGVLPSLLRALGCAHRRFETDSPRWLSDGENQVIVTASRKVSIPGVVPNFDRCERPARRLSKNSAPRLQYIAVLCMLSTRLTRLRGTTKLGLRDGSFEGSDCCIRHSFGALHVEPWRQLRLRNHSESA